VSAGLRPTVREGEEVATAPANFVSLMQRGWSADPTARPSFAEIVLSLSTMLRTLGQKPRKRKKVLRKKVKSALGASSVPNLAGNPAEDGFHPAGGQPVTVDDATNVDRVRAPSESAVKDAQVLVSGPHDAALSVSAASQLRADAASVINDQTSVPELQASQREPTTIVPDFPTPDPLISRVDASTSTARDHSQVDSRRGLPAVSPQSQVRPNLLSLVFIFAQGKSPLTLPSEWCWWTCEESRGEEVSWFCLAKTQADGV
jgi:hypothetical protein